MAGGTPIFFSKIALMIDTLGNDSFDAWCGITGLTKTSNKDIGTIAMPDCDDPDLPAWLEAYLISNQMVVTGTGTAARESFKEFEAWDRGTTYAGATLEGGMKTARLVLDIAKADGGGHYEGDALLSQWEASAQNRAPWTFSFGVTFSGQPTWVPLP